MRTLSLSMFILLLIGGPTIKALAQEKTIQQKPSTELEMFLQTKGQIIVKEFHDIGKISGQYGTGVTVGTLILSDPGAPSKKKMGCVLKSRAAERSTESTPHFWTSRKLTL